MDIKEKIKNLTVKYYPEILKIFQNFHSHPELSSEENATSEMICRILEELKIPYRKGFAKHGIIAHISSQSSAKTRVIGLRADMDALPINESTDLSYKSLYPGIMHACGHDVHLACLLGSAMIFSKLKDEITGSILLIFQPSEEKIPGGAKKMIDEGAFADIKPDIILAQHVMPELQTGTIGLRSGMMMASSDEIRITVKGKGGHGALPDQVIDPILISAHLILALQQIVSRKSSPIVPNVLSFGRVEANGAHNIIPDEVKLLGTFRTYNEVWRKQAHKTIITMSQTLAESMGGSCKVTIKEGYPSVINDDKITGIIKKSAQEFLGKTNVHSIDPAMASEDFSYFAEQFPAVFYRLGVNRKNTPVTPLHSPKFIADPESLITGTSLLSYLAISMLNN